MYCKNCGCQLSDSDNFCPQCGAPCNNEIIIEKTPSEQSNHVSPVYGILSIVFGAMGGWLGLLFGIIGLIKYKSENNKADRIRCIIGIVLFVVWIVILTLYIP